MTFRSLYLSMMILLPALLPAQDSADEFKRQYESGIRATAQEFENYNERVTAEYDEWEWAEKQAFEQYKAGVEAKWNEFRGNTPGEWVEYSRDKKKRTIVDFEKGTVTVEVLLDKEEAASPEAQQKLQQAVSEVLESKGSTDETAVSGEKVTPLSGEPVLTGQVVQNSGQTVTPSLARGFAEFVVDKNAARPQPVTGSDGTKRVKLAVSFDLAPNHIRVRAEKYKTEVLENARRFDLPPELVYAVIHTESYFNPAARSYVPAYGLMQLVPRSGARDAYKHVHGEDRLVRASYLYDAENNILLGSAYLNLLSEGYFKDVTDRQSRLYCAISAYNTGPGNVARAFTNSRNVDKAVKVINTLSAQEVYRRLRRNLPYRETREYIKKVTGRMEQYRGWMNGGE
jgi:membrane-bound lytic murein transglycosylase C